MTKGENLTGAGCAPDVALGEALRLFQNALEDVKDIALDLEQEEGPGPRSSELKARVRRVDDLAGILLKERHKRDERLALEGGTTGGGLDLARARTEIADRLAALANADRAVCVSGGAE
ncbi:MAG: hypothetical protein AAGF74_13615 [Pseudomonadota bacterium]